jgi:lipid-binding SYLF domain-containing protein
MHAPRRIAAALLVALIVAPAAARASSLEENVSQAVTILDRFKEMPEQGIPKAVLRDAKGIAILTVLKAGFVISGQGGEGLVVSRLGKSSWSGPSAIGTGGAGFGFQVGAAVTEFVIILNTDDAVKAFSRGGNVSIGGDITAAIGPVGRNLGADVLPVAAVYTYSRSQGLFAGVSLQGSVIATRDDANTDYYGRKVTPDEILSGKVRPPKSAAALEKALLSF